MADSWKKQGQTELYDGSHVDRLLGRSATRRAILDRLKKLSRDVGPDDVFILFLAGHGYARKIRPNVFVPRSFVFACPTFDLRQPSETGVPGQDLYRAIAAVPCRKLILLDCCHAGSTNVLRELAPEGIGPVMIAACRANESSYDIPFLGHGAFTNSVLEALDAEFPSVDRDCNRLLTVAELLSYVTRRVPETVAIAKPVLGDDAVQTPQGFIPRRSALVPVAGSVR
jgi:hypothetical protein